MRKRYVFIISLLLLTLALTACSGNNVKDSSDEADMGKDINTEFNNSNSNGETNNNTENNNQDSNIMDPMDNTNPDKASGQVLEDNENGGEVVAGMHQNVEYTKELLRTYEAGTVLDRIEELTKEKISALFYSEEIAEDIKKRINGKSYGVDCDVPYSDLRYIRLLHVDFEGKTRIGELIVNKLIAEDIVDIFRELYYNKYPIERIVLVDEYDADDNKSMEANNSSAFNYRKIADTDRLSNHSLGLAIDINPLYNPYVRTIKGKTVVLPDNGEEYADRSKDNPYYIDHEDLCYKEFIKRGFTWGGDWKNSKDYQHFEKSMD